MTRVRLGAVSFLNARPCVVGLDRYPRFDLRFDLPSRCAELLHQGAIDVGLIPSIEYLRGPGSASYCVVPDVAIASNGPVASVAVYTRKPMADVRSLALDTSSRTSVALARIMCARAWSINPAFEPCGPDLTSMLDRADAALLIGDAALFANTTVRLKPDTTGAIEIKPDTTGAIEIKPDTTGAIEIKPDTTGAIEIKPDTTGAIEVKPDTTGDIEIKPDTTGAIEIKPDTTEIIEKIDLGEAWTTLTGLPFVYAFWAGSPDALTPADVRALQEARDAGIADPGRVAAGYFLDPALQAIGARYLRDNIKYALGERELAGLTTFYRYAAELDLVPAATGVRFY